MKHTLLIITALLFITSTVIPQSKVNINNLVEYGGKMFKQDDDKPYTGLVFDLYRTTGNKSLEGRYKDGLRNGKWSWWNVDNKMDSSGTYKDGNLNGKWTYWNENGQKVYERKYKNGEKDGKWTFWYENGQKSEEGTWKEGKKDGKWTWYNEDEKTDSSGTFKDGKKDGLWTYWNENGQKESEGTYKDGVKTNKWRYWDENGQYILLAHYLLEVDIPTLVENLAVPVKPKADFLLAEIIEKVKQSVHQENFINGFVQSATENNLQLRRHFEGLGSTNAEIESGLNVAADDAINKILEILQYRFYEFGISEPTIQKQGSHRIIVELAGVTDTDRAEALLDRTGSLEFVYLKDSPSTQNIIRKIDAIQSYGDTALAKLDTVKADTNSSLLSILELFGDTLEAEAIFSSFLIPTPFGDIGVPLFNRFRVQNILERKDVKQIIQKDYGRFVWSSNPPTYVAGHENVYTIYYLDANPNNPRLTGQAVEDAVADIYNGQPIVSLKMNSVGAKIWSVITSRVGDRVAIVFDNKVHMAPVIRSKITDGRTQLEGLDDMEEAKDIAIVLRAGKLPAPIRKIYGRWVKKYVK